MNAKLLSVLACLCASPVLGQSFIGLGFLPGDNYGQAVALSADGSTVVGWGSSGGWRWRAFAIDSVGDQSYPTSVSADGSVVGGGHVTTSFNHPAFLWTPGGGTQIVPGVFSSLTPSPGISGDGRVLVGAGSTAGGSAVRWTASTGAVTLPPPPGPFIAAGNEDAMATSFDGSVVVGSASVQPLTGDGFVVPTRWTAAGGMQYCSRSQEGAMCAEELEASPPTAVWS